MHLRRPRLPTAFKRRLPGRTVRSRLTLVYGGLFLVSGAVLLVITGLLWGRATSGHFSVASAVSGRILQIAGSGAPKASLNSSRVAFHAVSGNGVISKQLGGQLKAVAANQQSSDLHQLLLYAGIALGIMALLSIGLGWLTSGRVLRPLRTITAAARRISATNLHERLSLEGPDDELKELGDTVDQLLGRLERSFQSQRQFVANASHELRTPLATMRASLDVAMAKPEPIPPQTITLADRLHDELDQIDRLLESFLALARAQRGPVDEDVAVSVRLLAASALDDRANTIAAKGLEVRQENGPDVRVRGNETLLARMVENVIDNAVRHNARNGWIRVRIESEEDTARLIVENGGPVLGGEAVKDLTQPFRRLGAERTGSDAGFGLGLSIVAAVTDAHGGQLELDALNSGGLRVLIELPVEARVLAGALT